MHLLAYVPLTAPLVALPAARPVAERVEPRTATWLLTVCSIALAAASTAALGILAVAGVARLPAAAALGHWSATTVRAGDNVSRVEAGAALLLLGLATAAALRALWRRARALAAAGFEAACLPADAPYVVVEDPTPQAYALPGIPGKVVVSTGMLAALDDGDRHAMLAHEHAHLRGHHYAFVTAAHLAATANPLLRPAAAAVAYTVERWADEHAASACGNRRQVAVAVGKAALATRNSVHRRHRLAALGVLGVLGSRRDRLRDAGPVPRRVAALLSPPPRHRLVRNLPVWPIGTAAAFLGALALCTFAAAHDLHVLLELAGAD